MLKAITSAFSTSSSNNSHALLKSTSSDFIPLNDYRQFEFVVVQPVPQDGETKNFRRTLQVSEDGITVQDQTTKESEFISFLDIKKFYVEETSEWRVIRHLKGERFETLCFRTPRAGEIQSSVNQIIAKIVRDRRAMTM